MRPHGTPKPLEKRRRHAIQSLTTGKTLSAVAKRIGCSVGSAWLWAQVFRRHGAAGLAAKAIPGRPPKLPQAQPKRLTRLLLKGPQAWGYSTDLWTTRREAEVIWRQFRVRYHPHHVWRLRARKGPDPAKVATARRLATIVYRVLSRRCPYRSGGARGRARGPGCLDCRLVVWR